MAKKRAKQLKTTLVARLIFVEELKLHYEDVEYDEERIMVNSLSIVQPTRRPTRHRPIE